MNGGNIKNVLRIAHKEFIDILSNRIILLVLILFISFITIQVYDFSVTANGGHPGARAGLDDNNGAAAANYLLYLMADCGTIIGVVLGCSAISTERISNALNTLMVKPIYRDTIINGKILGSLTFFAIYMVLIMAVATAEFLGFCGNALAPYLTDYFTRLPFVLIFILIYVGVFLSLSLLISLLVRDQAVAMIISVLMVYFSQILLYPDISRNIGRILPGYGLQGLFISLSPRAVLMQLHTMLANSYNDAYSVFLFVLSDTVKLLLFMVVAIVLSYIVFVKREIS